MYRMYMQKGGKVLICTMLLALLAAAPYWGVRGHGPINMDDDW